MRHNKKFNHLGRKSAHRKAMLSNMASSLILHKRITTTVAKAKALRMYVEPLITKAKDDTTHARRVVFSYLQDKNAVSELFRDVSARVGDRPGGYTRILRTGNRLGDNAEMCIMELVDYNESMLAAKTEAAKGKKRRARRSGTKKGPEVATAPAATPKVKAKKEEIFKAEPKKEEIAEVVEHVTEEIAETAESVTETVAEVVEPVAETIAEIVEPATEAVVEVVENKMEDLAEVAEEKVEELKEEVQEVKETVEEKIEEVAETVAEEIEKTAETIAETAEEVKAEIAEELADEVEESSNEEQEEKKNDE